MASINDSKSGMRNQGGIADLIVKGAIALVTAAFFIGAYLQFRVTFWLALVAALSVYITLLMLHALMRRSERVDALVSEVSKLEGKLSRFKGPGPAEPAPALRKGPSRDAAAARPSVGPPVGPPGARSDPKVPPTLSSSRPQAPVGKGAPLGLGPQLPRPNLGAPQYAPPAGTSGAPHREPQPTLSAWPGSSPAEPVHDYWSARTAEPPLSKAPQASAGEGSAIPAPTAPADREDDLEAVQGMIKRLANEVSLGDANLGSEQPQQESSMRASIDALFATADTMRAAATKIAPLSARRDRESTLNVPPPIAPTHARLSTIGEAIAANRMDVTVEPIVGLADHQVHHYEVTVCPRDERGAVVPIAGHDRQLARTGLLPLLDSARLKRAAQVLRTFAEQGQKHCVFVATSGEALATDRFLDDLAHLYRERETIAGDLVLSFSQADIRTFGGIEWSALTDMRDLNFRFCLRDVTDLDYEFTALRAAGFAFVSLDAASLVNGLPGPGGVAAAADVCRHMSEVGLAAIVDGIDDEGMRATILQCGAPLGQGPLFGKPMTVAGKGFAGPGIAAA